MLFPITDKACMIFFTPPYQTDFLIWIFKDRTFEGAPVSHFWREWLRLHIITSSPGMCTRAVLAPFQSDKACERYEALHFEENGLWVAGLSRPRPIIFPKSKWWFLKPHGSGIFSPEFEAFQWKFRDQGSKVPEVRFWRFEVRAKMADFL